MSSLDVLLVKENYELYTRIQSDKRKQLLSYIYTKPRKYKELIEFTRLKPGSLYHHLNILEPLIEKKGHGTYKITDLGIKVVEELNLIEEYDTKPKIITENVEASPINDDTPIIPTDATSYTMDDRLASLWLGNTSLVILSLIIIMSIYMALQGIALAGSALYATGTELAIKFDFAAFILGVLVLYSIEKLKQSYPVYNRIKYIITIRIMSMLPGTIISISLFLLFTSNIIPSDEIYPWLFVISLIIGTLTATMGISYLRGVKMQKSLDLAIIIGVIDLLLGVVILIS